MYVVRGGGEDRYYIQHIYRMCRSWLLFETQTYDNNM